MIKTEMIKIVLADDHKIVRHGIKALLETEEDLSIVGEASNGLEAIKQAEKLQPDILIADISMPGMNGIDVTKQVKKLSSKTNVIILSMHSAEVYVQQALKAGARGYVVKESGPEQLLNAIHEVLAGGYYVSPPLSRKIVDDYLAELAAGKDQ